MTTTRRGFLGMLLASAAAPAIVKAESLMKIIVPRNPLIDELERFSAGRHDDYLDAVYKATERYTTGWTDARGIFATSLAASILQTKEVLVSDILQKSFADQLQPFYNRGAINLDQLLQRKDILQ